ncbi:hypothetical protein DL98DRAFT_352642, partial [Cadophora sp. DSE1049]
ELVLQPQPSRDPNDPLNWSPMRKYINFAISNCIQVWILELSAGRSLPSSITLSYNDLANSYAASLAGLAFGCLLFIPFALKFGKRPVYIFSTLVSCICAIWAGNAIT